MRRRLRFKSTSRGWERRRADLGRRRVELVEALVEAVEPLAERGLLVLVVAGADRVVDALGLGLELLALVVDLEDGLERGWERRRN